MRKSCTALSAEIGVGVELIGGNQRWCGYPWLAFPFVRLDLLALALVQVVLEGFGAAAGSFGGLWRSYGGSSLTNVDSRQRIPHQRKSQQMRT